MGIGEATAIGDTAGRAYARGAVGPRRRFDYVAFMAIATALYLLFELAFNARLLDVTGGLPSRSALHGIEWWGRLISGVALTLALWGLVLPRLARHRVRLSATIPLLMMIGAGSIACTFHFESELVSNPAAHSSARTRQDAYLLEQCNAALIQGNLRIAGFPNGAHTMGSPAGKAFLSVFPLLATHTPGIAGKLRTIFDKTLTGRVLHRVGNAGAVFNETVRKADRSLAKGYRHYERMSRAYSHLDAHLHQKETGAWSSYKAHLRRHGLSPGNVPLGDWRRVRDTLERQGLHLPPAWDPADRTAFDHAVAARAHRRARATFDADTRKAFGAALPPGLSYREFIAKPAVRRKWLRAQHLTPGKQPWLTPLTSFHAWDVRYFKPMVAKRVAAKKANIVAPVSDFKDGGPRARTGRHALEALLAPAIALTFSILGALYHLFKSSHYLGRLALPRLAHVSKGILVVVIAVGLTPFFLPNPVSTSPAFKLLLHQTAKAGVSGRIEAVAARWVVQAQPYFYPENDLIRRHLFQNFGFGWNRSPHG